MLERPVLGRFTFSGGAMLTPEFLAVAHRVREGLKAGHSYED